MPTFLRGWDGKVTQGTADAALVAMLSWEVEITQAVEELGPFLNDSGTTYNSRGGVSAKWSWKGVVPSGGDTNQTAVVNALSSGIDIKQTFVSTGAGSIVIPNSLVETIKRGHDSKNGPTIEASGRNNGAFTY